MVIVPLWNVCRTESRNIQRMRNPFPIAVILPVVLLVAVSCKDSIKPEVSFNNNNVLLPAIEFNTPGESEVFIRYWPVNNTSRQQQSKTTKGRNHRIVLLNLKPATEYNYQIHTSAGQLNDVFSFRTGTLPEEVTQTKKQIIDTTQFKGFALVRRLSPKGVDVIIDNEGDVVWYHLYDTVVRRPFVWTSKNTILSIYDSAQIVEYDIYGNKLLDIKLEDHGIPNMIHHDAVFNSTGDIVSLTHDSLKMDLRKFGYGENRYIRADGIVVLSTDAKKIWEWNLFSVYNPLDHPEKKVNLKQSVGHANSIAIDKDGHYLVSFREFSQVWKINSTDGSVIWKLGKDGDFKMDEDAYFIKQHAICFNDAGELMMFDNGDKKTRPNSRVLSFKLNENTMEATVRAKVILPLELSADKMCSAVSVSDGKYLVCTSKKNGIISVVNDDAEILWRVDLTRPSYRAYYLSDPFTRQ